ncbi:MAG: ABC transporter permease subunit, partial [Clostridia bacterium]
DFLNKVTEPYLVILNSLPKIALGPIIIIWCGAGYNAIIAMTVLICIITTIITVQDAFLSVPQEKIQLLRGMGASKLDIFKKLIFKASLPTTITMLKINVGLSFVGSIMGEYLVSRFGLGYLIVYGGQVFKLDLVLACTIVLMILAGIIYYLVSLLERLVIRYK